MAGVASFLIRADIGLGLALSVPIGSCSSAGSAICHSCHIRQLPFVLFERSKEGPIQTFTHINSQSRLPTLLFHSFVTERVNFEITQFY